MADAVLPVVAVLAVALAVAGWLAHRLRLNPVVGYLVVGVAAAPAALGGDHVPVELVQDVNGIGILLLLFFIGMELNLQKLRDALRTTRISLPFGILVPAVAVSTVARLMGWTVPQALALGLACAVASDLFGERLTAGRGVEEGARRRVLGVLVAEDLAAAALLVFLVVMVAGGGPGGWAEAAGAVGLLGLLLVLLVALALLVMPRVLDSVARTHVHELMVLGALGLMALFGILGRVAGSAELGALVAGVAAAEAGSRYALRNSMLGLRDIAVAGFFFATGLGVDATELPRLAGPILAVAAAVLLGKGVVHAMAAAVSGLGLKGSLQTAFSLGSIGEFGLILLVAAEAAGLGHPDLRATAVGALLVLFILSTVLMSQVDRLAHGFYRMPRRVKAPVEWGINSLRRARTTPSPRRGEARLHARRLASNLLLLAGLLLAAAWLLPRLQDRIGGVPPALAAMLTVGLVLAFCLPLTLGAYKAYRGMVHDLVGLRAGEREGAGRVRARLVDAVVAVALLVLVVPVALHIPYGAPVLIGGVIVTFIVASLAWRRLTEFHRTLEETVTRVLGQDPEGSKLLDRVLQQYPWGVRFAAVAIPPDSPVSDRTVQESRIGELTGALVAVVQRRGHEIVNPAPDERLRAGDTLVLMGDPHQLARAEALVVAHGEALRLEAQSRSAHVEEAPVGPGSPWAGRTLRDCGVRERTGCLVVGLWKEGASHPRPYEPELAVRAGDRLIVLGTPLQVQRVRAVASGTEPVPEG